MIKWYWTYLARYIKSGGSMAQIKNIDWFLKLNGHTKIRKIWRWYHNL